MCGITGYRLIDGNAGRWAADLPAAVRSVRHRGPDDEGTWYGAGQRTGFGHRRLSILDLSTRGRQPMTSACGGWVMIYNGEVYNYKEIRAELRSLGHRFEGTGDSEVILAAFSQWGPEAVSRFVGMFAIALWQERAQRLHLLRDRLGVKPLYYRWDGKALCFGSELRALRAFTQWQPEIDLDALGDYLRYGYINDPLSIYRRVYKLPPAHRLVLEADGRMQLVRYWNVTDHQGRRQHRGEDELCEELEALMIDAFKYRLISDVPVGVFLSGGVDSSMVAAILQKHGTQQIKTYTIGFDDPQFDESPHAGDVARHLGTEHHCRVLKVNDAKQLLPGWGDLYDEPFADESGLATLMVSQVAAEQVKVVLSADGGDELFSGYNSYASVLRQWGRIKGLAQGLRVGAERLIEYSGVALLDGYLASQPNASLRLASTKLSSRVARIGQLVGARGVGELFDNALAHIPCTEVATLTGHAAARRTLADAYAGADGEKLCLWDLHHYLPADVLTKVDRATMAVSIEGREPLIDHRLAEFAFSLPFEMRRGALGSKHLLKKVLYKYVPRRLVDRPKRGFAVPVKQWLTEDLAGLVDEHLNPVQIRRQGLFDPGLVSGYLKRLRAGDVAVRQRVWSLLAFQMWHRRWMAA